MSIDSEQVQASITEGDRALQLFTDRYSFTRLLAECINDDEPDKRILFLHGAGGNGKSLLLRYLQRYICKRLTNEHWARIRDKSDDELQAALKKIPATGHLPVPSALLDFSSRAGSTNTDLFDGLLKIRQMLAASLKGTPYRLRFPLHTYGCFLYLQKTNRLKEVDDLFRFEEVGLVKDFVGLMKELPTGVGIGLSVLKLVNKYSGNRLTHYKRRFRLSEQRVKQLQAMDAERELRPLLPVLLAQDLQAGFAEKTQETPERVVLFFDTHEAFYGSDRNHKANFFRDVWLRRLLRGLLETPEIVVIVGGRDVPRWAEADEYELETEIPEDCVFRVPVDSLAVADADSFLQKAGIVAPEMRQSLICYSREEGAAVHPLHLGLCVDVVRAAEREGRPLSPGDFASIPAFKKKNKYLIRQLLSHVDDEVEYAVRAMAACRSFDFPIYRLLGNALDFAVSRPAYNRVVSFSFIREIEIGAEGRERQYRIHDLLRRLDDTPEERQAHQVLAEYYQEQSSLERIYHVNQLDWLKGTYLWIQLFEKALALSQYEECRLLLDIRRDLSINAPFELGLLSNAEGHYLKSLTLYDAALHEFNEAVLAYGRAADLVLHHDARILTNKSNALRNVADMHVALSQNGLALQKYDESVAAYTQVLLAMPNDSYTLNSKGLTLVSRANLQAKTSRIQDAQQSYEDAITSYEQAITKAPGFKKLRNNKGLALKGLADFYAALSQYSQSRQRYQEAVTSYDEAIQLDANYVLAMNNKGVALESLADLYAKNSHHTQASKSYIESIATQCDALRIAPNYVQALTNKGLSHLKLGQLQMQLQELEAAVENFRAALALFKQSLALAPNNRQIREIYQQLAHWLAAHDDES